MNVVEKPAIIFGIIVFYVMFGLLYLAIGNTINENRISDLPAIESSAYVIPDVASSLNPFNDNANNKYEGTNRLLGFVVNGISGYGETDGLRWINFIFVIITAFLVFLIIITILHG